MVDLGSGAVGAGAALLARILFDWLKPKEAPVDLGGVVRTAVLEALEGRISEVLENQTRVLDRQTRILDNMNVILIRIDARTEGRSG